MARIVVGGYHQDLIFNMEDQVVRAIQGAATQMLKYGRGFFLRHAGTADGEASVRQVWIGSSSAIRFEYDGAVMPAPDEDLVGTFRKHLDAFGGIILARSADDDEDDEYEDAAEKVGE